MFIGVASQSFGVLFGVIVLDHKSIPVIPLIAICMTGAFEITAQMMALSGGFRLLDSVGLKRADEGRKTHFYGYLKFLGLALSISFLSALFETASILGTLPFGL